MALPEFATLYLNHYFNLYQSIFSHLMIDNFFCSSSAEVLALSTVDVAIPPQYILAEWRKLEGDHYIELSLMRIQTNSFKIYFDTVIKTLIFWIHVNQKQAGILKSCCLLNLICNLKQKINGIANSQQLE